jgi:outer membrane protein assembly factor BamB
MRRKLLVCGLAVGSLLLACGLVVVVIAVRSQQPAQTTEGAHDTDTQKPGKTDITVQVREMNSDKYVAPSAAFRRGHVFPKALPAGAVTRTPSGFTVQLPSRAPVPTPTVYGGRVYVSGGFHSKEYYCFDAVSGAPVWGVSLDDDGPTSAVCGDGVAVFNTESCTIFALDATTGKHLWSHWLGDPLTSTPTLAGGRVYASYPAAGRGATAAPSPTAPGKGRPDASHVLACFELKTGKILWQCWINSDVMSAPVAVEGEVYAATFAGTVYKFRQRDGAVLSAHRSRATSAPVVVGPRVYWTQRADRGKGERPAEEIAGLGRAKHAPAFAAAKRQAAYLDAKIQDGTSLKVAAADLDASNGFSAGAPPAANAAAAYYNVGQGNVSTLQAFQGSRILSYRGANYNCMGDELVRTDPKDGTVRWRVKLRGDLAKQGGHLAAPPAAAGGQLFLATLDGAVWQVDPDKGTVSKTYPVGSALRTQPAIEGGRIYVGTQDGKVVCIDTGDTRFTGWPTWGGDMAHTNVAEPARR